MKPLPHINVQAGQGQGPARRRSSGRRSSVIVIDPPYFDESSEDETADPTSPKKEKEGRGAYSGIILALIASFCFSIITLLVKILKDYGANQYTASFWRYAGVTVPSIPVLIYLECVSKRKVSLFEPLWPLNEDGKWKIFIGLLSRGIIGSTSVILRYYSLQYLTIGDATTITFGTPVLVTIMAHFILGEKCGVIPILVSFSTLFGVMLIARPPIFTGQEEFDEDTLKGTLLATGSLFCAALTVIITRTIREVHCSLMLSVFGVIGMLNAFSMPHLTGAGEEAGLTLPSTLEAGLMLLAISVISLVGQMCIILALKFEQAGPVSLLRSVDVIFGFILQFAFLGVVPDVFSAIGGSIVLCGVTVIASRKWVKSFPEGGCMRKGLGWILY